MIEFYRLKNIKSIIKLFVAYVYAWYLSGIPSFLFKDRWNYQRYATYSSSLLEDYMEKGYLFFFKEPLFLLFNTWLSGFNDPSFTINFFVFFICFIVCLFAQKVSKNIVLFIFFILFLFFNTQTFAIQLVTIRQGVALGLLLLLFLYFKKYIKNYLTLIIFIGILGTIHNSFFIVAFGLFIDWFCTNILKRKELKFRLIVNFFVVLLFNILLIVALAKLLDVKQQISDDFDSSSGGGGFLLWGIVFVYILIYKPQQYENKTDFYMYMLSLTGLIMYLTSYFLSPISGRLIGVYIPFILYILLNQLKLIDLVFTGVLFVIFTVIFISGGVEGFLQVPFSYLKRYLI